MIYRKTKVGICDFRGKKAKTISLWSDEWNHPIEMCKRCLLNLLEKIEE